MNNKKSKAKPRKAMQRIKCQTKKAKKRKGRKNRESNAR